MPILVTGGTGFLGINLVRLLTSRGERVRLLVREGSGRLGLESDLIEFRRGDVTDAASIADAMRGCDQVYHLAGWVRLTPWGFKEAYRINVEGTANVCRAALSQGVRRLVHTSSIATIGCGTLENPADETTEWNLNGLGVPYYRTKREAEQVVLRCVDQGLDAVIVNPTYVVGPWDVKPTAGRMVIQVATGRQRVYPKRGGINFVDARQAALGHVLAMERGRVGERYILGGENLTYRAFFERVATIADVPPPRWGIGYHTLALPAAMGSLAGRVFAKTFRDKNLCVLRSGFVEHFVTQDKARRELGLEPTPIDEVKTPCLTRVRCENCGRPIPLERIAALPEVTRCVKCQESFEEWVYDVRTTKEKPKYEHLDAIRAALAWFVEYGYIRTPSSESG